MRLAIFDFCDTLVNFQTADHFCKYVLKKESRHSFLKIDLIFEKYKMYFLFSKLGLSCLSQKKFLLKGLKGITNTKLEFYGERYVQDVIEKRLNGAVLQRLINHKKQKDVVVINSGGYDSYLQFFSKKYDVEYILATRLKYINDTFSGEILGCDCLGREKVRRLKEIHILNNVYSEIYVYSDSFTDKPMFDLASQRIAVIKSNRIPKWCTSEFQIINV